MAINLIKPSSSIEIASEETQNFVKTCQNPKNANRVTLIIHRWLKCLIFSEFLSWIMQSTRKGWTRDQNIDSYEEISFLGKIYCFYQKRKWSFKNSDCCYVWSINHIQYVVKISERSNQYSRRYDILKLYPIGITFLYNKMLFK